MTYDQKVYGSSIEVPFISLVIFQLNLNFLYRFLKHTQISNLMKIRPVGAKLFQADRQTDMMKLMVTFCDFTNMPKNQKSAVHFYSN